MEFHSLVVDEVVQDAEEAVRLRLTLPPAAREAFHFVPGQHVTLRVSLGERTLRRTYSLVSVPGSGQLEIAVRTQPAGRVSGWIAKEVRAGTTLTVLPPAGSFRLPSLPAGPAHVLALAAGSGVTPVFAMVRELLAHSPQVRCTVVIGNQSLARTMLRQHWLDLKDRYLARLALYFVMSRERQEVEWLNGRLDRGWLERMSGTLFDPQSLQAVLLCGPGGFITELSQGLQALGLAPDRVHFERFSLERARAQVAASSAVSGDAAAPTAAVPGPGSAGSAAPSTEVTVVMDGRHRTFVMARDGTRLLEAAEKAGLTLPYSCRDGICSTCRVKVLEGEVDLGEQYALEPWELAAGFTLACQAKPCSARLTLSYDER